MHFVFLAVLKKVIHCLIEVHLAWPFLNEAVDLLVNDCFEIIGANRITIESNSSLCFLFRSFNPGNAYPNTICASLVFPDFLSINKIKDSLNDL